MGKRRKLSNGTSCALKMLDPVRGWPASTLLDRLQSCRAMLAIHGYIGTAQNRSISERIYQQAERESLQSE